MLLLALTCFLQLAYMQHRCSLIRYSKSSTTTLASHTNKMSSMWPFAVQGSRNTVLTVRVLNFILLIAVFVTNGLSSSGRINNIATGTISDRNPSFIVPAGYAFSIWGES